MENEAVNNDILPSDLSALRRVLTVAAVDAGQALSLMVGRDIVMSAPDVEMVDLCDVPQLLSDPGQEAIAIHLSFEGDGSGQVILLLDSYEALRLADILLGQEPGGLTGLDDMSRSALGEVGNITASSFLNALVRQHSLCLMPSPPEVIHDLSGAILGNALLPLAMTMDRVLMVHTSFSESDHLIKGYILLLPNGDTLQPLLWGDAA